MQSLKNSAVRLAGRLGMQSALLRLELRRRAHSAGLRLERDPGGALVLTAPSANGSPARAVRIAAGHGPYAFDVVSHFDYYHGAVAAHDVGGVRVVDYSRTGPQTLLPSGDVFTFTGFPEPEATTQVYLHHARLKEGDVALDFGAYCGGSTVRMARAVGPSGQVYAYEPDPMNAAALDDNLARHGIDNVTIVRAGVWSSTTTLEFAAEGNLGSAVAALLPRAQKSRPVEVFSMADVVKRMGERQRGIAFVKMDIEGAEGPALEAGLQALDTQRPRFAIEPHALPNGELNTQILVDLLERHGYAIELADQGIGVHPLILAQAA